MPNVIKHDDPRAADAVKVPDDAVCCFCHRSNVPVAGETGDYACIECLGALVDVAHPPSAVRDDRDRATALAARDIAAVIRKYNLAEGPMWIALGTAGAAMIAAPESGGKRGER